jgi:Cu/Ag efflux protein CusF
VKTNGTQAVIYFLVVMGISIAAAGIPASGKGEKKFVLHGQVVEMDKNKNAVTVKHEDIPGLMPAMTMPFKVKDQKIWHDLQPGDRIVAEIDTTSDKNGYLLENIRITEKGAPRGAPTGILTRRLSIGERIPNLVLTNQDGATDAQIRKTIIEGKGTMPAFDQRLSDQEVSCLISYLHTLKKETNGQR